MKSLLVEGKACHCIRSLLERFKNAFAFKIGSRQKGLNSFWSQLAIRWTASIPCWRTNSKNSCLKTRGRAAKSPRNDGNFTMLVWGSFNPTPTFMQLVLALTTSQPCGEPKTFSISQPGNDSFFLDCGL